VPHFVPATAKRRPRRRVYRVLAPLLDAGLTKAEIRKLSKCAGLSTCDRPSSPCLSSRIPYGTPVTIENLSRIERAESALPSVGGGLIEVPVIAVPTSTGYGASFGGLTALLTMLNCCASNVCVVNIDNGFGAGYLASAINRL